MLAVVGYLFPEFFTFPGFLSPSNNLRFSDVPNGIRAIFAVPLLGWLQIIAVAGYFEFSRGRQANEMAQGDWKRYEEPIKSRKLLIELKNGRLAMLAMAGVVCGELAFVASKGAT